MSDEPTLGGYVIGVTAERRRTELGEAFERRGARVLYGPAIHIVPLVDDAALKSVTQRVLSAPVDFVVGTTGVGFRGWLTAADEWGLGEALEARIGAAAILARGPKVRGAVRAAGLREAWSPDSESSAEVLEHLLARGDLAGKRVAVQLHGDPLSEFVAALRSAGVEVLEVPVYRWEAPQDEGPLRSLIEQTAAGRLDCVTFTSAPAATNFLHTAQRLGVHEDVLTAMHGPVLVAAVGDVTATPLVEAGLPVAIPPRFRLGALVREVVERLAERPRVSGGIAARSEAPI